MILPVVYCFVAAVSMAIAGFCFYLYFKRRTQPNLVFDNSGFFLMVGSALALGSVTFYLVLLGDWQLSLVPVGVCVLTLLGFASWHNEIIIFDETGFTRRDFFMRSHRHSYQDITECRERILKQSRKHQEVQTLFYMGSQHFSLARRAYNYGKFAEHIREYGRQGIDP